MPSLSPMALDALRGPILSILRKSDLSSISAKQVRVALINTPADAMQGDVGSDVAGPRLLPRLGVDIEEKAHKKAVDGIIKECFDTINEEISGVKSGNGASNFTPKLALPGMGGVRGSSSSSTWPGSTPTGAPTSSASSTPATKKRSRVTADEVNSDEEDADAETISKLAKKTKAAAKPKAPRKKKSNLNEDGTEKEKKPPNPNNPFNKPVILSDDMSAICGGKEMPRYMITKQLWIYIKANELQDPTNKRRILCDPPLQKLFGKSDIDSFEMARLISAHVTKKIDP